MRKTVWFSGVALLAGALLGCNQNGDAVPYSDAEKAPAGDEEHAHDHEGPHGGHIVELTDDHSVHGELVFDQEGKTARFYLLGEDLETPVEGSAVSIHGTAGEEDVEVDFKPAGEGETASEFTVAFDQLPSSDIEAYEGHFHVTVDGKELSGDLAHAHDHEHESGEHAHEGEGEQAPAPQ